MSELEQPAIFAGTAAACETQRHNKWNVERRRIFLAHLAMTANVTRSAAEAGMSLSAAYLLKKRDETFARAWLEALDIGFCELEMALLRDGIKGSERIETVVVGEDRQLKYEKRIISRHPASSLRLLQMHQAEVHHFRAEREDEDDRSDEEALKADMGRVRERLLAQGYEVAGLLHDD